MRTLAWLALFSLQLGIFVCGAGIDVCHATGADTTLAVTQSEMLQPAGLLPPADNDHESSPIDQTCSAHAAHVFLGQPAFHKSPSDMHLEAINLLSSLNLPEVFHLIEQPPKASHC